MAVHYSEKKDLFPLAGGCACGLIRYQLTRGPVLVHCCYCTACQRQTGSVLGLNAIIESSDLTQLPPAKPAVAGATSPIPAGLVPAFATSTGAVSAAHDEPNPEPTRICVPTESGLGQTIVHCPVCYTGLWNYYVDAGSQFAYVRVGTLDRPWEIDPDVHIYTRSRKAFLTINDGKPQFEEYYPSRKALLREDALERVQALKPAIDKWKGDLRAALSN
ncbi:hypothetical protein AK830_g1107 [Neonectria ditissima]|uniref:CENP-V/GFA domain-containing protein n=1 Tax=Neonectria ditissima TaxID=78410 RepID=A0A0P7BFN1_9HYPO|nr:hypothetical protein AK830_g1107 [Neonectria ditissima]